jgi:hypothetical protein
MIQVDLGTLAKRLIHGKALEATGLLADNRSRTTTREIVAPGARLWQGE